MVICLLYLSFCRWNPFLESLIPMRGGKKGARKGRERVLVENEDDIIARNMMVYSCGFFPIHRNEKRKRREDMKNQRRNRKKKLVLPILTLLPMPMNRMKSLS